MTENKNDQHSQQTSNNSIQQSTQHSSDPDLNKMDIKVEGEMDIKVEETEEWDAVITDQRRPQFRCNENYGRRNF